MLGRVVEEVCVASVGTDGDGQGAAITFKATYILVYAHNALTGAEVCV